MSDPIKCLSATEPYSPHIRSIFVTDRFRFRIRICTLSALIPNSKKCGNKYSFTIIHPYPLRFHPYTHVQVPSTPHADALPSPAVAADLTSAHVAAAPAVADVVVSPTAAEPAVTPLTTAARGVPAPPRSPSHVPDAPKQHELPPAGSPPTPAATPPAAPPGHGMVTCLWDNTHREKKYTDGAIAIYKLSGAVAKPASINLQKLVLSPIGSINLGFILREDLLLCSSYLPLGVPNWVPNKHYQ
jgi:hypothetical protein